MEPLPWLRSLLDSLEPQIEEQLDQRTRLETLRARSTAVLGEAERRLTLSARSLAAGRPPGSRRPGGA